MLYDADAQAFTIRGLGEAQMMTNLQFCNRIRGFGKLQLARFDAMEQFLKKKTSSGAGPEHLALAVVANARTGQD